jgi:uncharacterized membrane protein
MQLLALYFGALGSFALATCLIWDTSPFALLGGSKYEWRRRRRLLGKVFYIVGAICLVMALVAQMGSYLLAPN